MALIDDETAGFLVETIQGEGGVSAGTDEFRLVEAGGRGHVTSVTNATVLEVTQTGVAGARVVEDLHAVLAVEQVVHAQEARVAQVADAERLVGQHAQAGAQAHVGLVGNHRPQIVGRMAFRGTDGGD